MNREGYKTKRQPKPKRSNTAKKVPATETREWSSTPKLREIYATRTEWATKKLPAIKEK